MTTKKSMKAVFDCSADEAGELSFREGDILVDVEESGEEGWYTGRIQNTSETGLFPYNYVVQVTAAQSQNYMDERPLSKFPPIDAFEAAITSGKISKSSNNNVNSIPSAFTADSKAKLPATSSISNSNTIGLGVKLYGDNSNANSFTKPKLKPVGSMKSTAYSPTRSRSYSTSAILNEAEKEPIQAEKTLRPSQLLNGKGTKSALELALSKGSPKSSSSNRKSNNTFLKNNTAGIALHGMSSIKPNSSNSNNDKEEDGFQMIKPSQLRKNQTATSSIRPFASQSTSFAKSTTATTPSWKKTADTKASGYKISGDKSASSESISSFKLITAPSSSPMPRLPSRPISTATRRSRNSRNSSSSSLNLSPITTSNKTVSNAPNFNLTAVREPTEKATPPPILKPKPQINSTTTAKQPSLPPRPKLRSTSNPPPIQPKPAMSCIEILLSKSNKNESAPAATIPNVTVSSKPTTAPPPRNAATKPAVSTAKPTVGAKFIVRPSLDSWQSADNTKNQPQDVNVKPSAVLKNNRARSATNPVSSSSSTAPPDWMAALRPKAPTTTKSGFHERPTSPITHPVSLSQAPSATTATIEPAKKKADPPPPPPSRPPKSKNTTFGNHSKKKQRYETLFESIHDDGYVDGETAHFVWLKSRLSNEDLARIWKECDPDHKGLLDKHAFIDGMSKIDELLSMKQQQQQAV
ncbi:hypothetical protein BD408DRAFT_416683 [Parasitella parasitica]|nr:hypothetical protein BD408DRAFT_416683 [Parasitella parasitica]